MTEMLKLAHKQKYAVGNFDCFNVEMIKGVVYEAEQNRAPIILAFCDVFEDLIKIEEFAGIAKVVARAASVPVCLHLDHATSFENILRALKCGFTSVMVDASDKPLQDNIAATRKVVEIAEIFDASVEAELGHVGGLEGMYSAEEYEDVSYTVVAEAVEFVEKTGVDALAVAIGTVHGVYKSEPKLNIDRLIELNAALGIPLVLHGGSGLSDDDMRKCIANGISKINIFTDMTLGAMDCMKRDADIAISYFEKCQNVSSAAGKVALAKMKVFDSVGRA